MVVMHSPMCRQISVTGHTNQPNYTVAIHADSSGEPATTELDTLSGGTSLTSTLALQTFTAPGTGISLDATTVYWLVMDVTGAANLVANVSIVNTDAEDGSSAAGWTIADDRRVRARTQTAGWAGIGNRPAEFRFTVEGYEDDAPIDPLSQPPRDPIYVTYDGQQYEVKAYSAHRSTLWDYFESECTRLRSVSDPYRDYSLWDADGRRIQASNGWKYVYVQNSQGDVTGTRPMYISECASNKVYQRQAFCNNYTTGQLAPSNEDNVCPDYRTW